MTDNSSLAIQMLDRLDGIKRDVNSQSNKIERLATVQEIQAKELDRLNTNVEQVRSELPRLNSIVESHARIRSELIEHDRKINEHTGRFEVLTSRITPKHGVKRPSSLAPPKTGSPMDALKDWSNIIRWLAWVAILSASVTAGLATANQMGWLGGKTEAPAVDNEKLLEELRKIQDEIYEAPGLDGKITHSEDLVNE